MTEPRDPTAVMGRRIVAYFIDIIVYSAAFAVPFFLLAQSATVERVSGDPDFEVNVINGVTTVRAADTIYALEDSDRVIVYAIGIGVFLLFAVLLQGLRGVTIGKGLTGIRTVRADGEPCGIGRAIVRELLWIVDAFPYFLVPLVGGVCAFASKGHKRVGDMAGGTYVIQRAYVSQPVNPEGAMAPSSGARSWEPGAEAWEPAAPAATGAAVSGAAPAAAPTYEPQWDAARGAYLQWDPRRQVWLQFDDAAQEWKPIS